MDKEKALASWRRLLEIGRTMSENEPGAESAVSILCQMREEENIVPRLENREN